MVGLRIAPEKTKVWLATDASAQGLPQALRTAVVRDLPVLGSTLYHHDRDDDLAAGFGPSEQGLLRAADLVRDTAATLKQAQEKGLCCQVAGAILRYVTVGAPQHLLRSRLWSPQALARYDQAVGEAWESLVGVDLSPQQRQLGNLPLREGGAAFGQAAPRAAAAFLAGWRHQLWRQCGGAPVYTEAGLEAAVPALAADLRRARADLVALSPLLQNSEKLDFTKEPSKHLQRELTDAVTFVARARLLDQLTDEVHRARLRQGGGPGAGSFLCVPQKGVRAMADGAWRMALRRRLLCTADRIISPASAETQCQHTGSRGACGAPLGGFAGLVHSEGCKVGGGVVGGHNEIRDILLNFARTYVDPRAMKEQRLESLRTGSLVDALEDDLPGDVLDVVFNHDGRRVALDVAVVGAHQDPALVRTAANRDGAAASREEREKRRRYAGLNITPCVFEIGGRAGDSAMAAIRMLAVMAGGDAGAPLLAAALWQEVSVALQSAVAWRVASAHVRAGSMAAAGCR